MTLLRWYYFSTPLFFVADAVWGWNVRVAFLDQVPAGRWAYYALCSGIAVVGYRKPALVAQLGLLESSANLGLLMVSVFVWYARMLEWAGSESAIVTAIEPRALVNFVLAAGAGAVSFYVQRARAAAQGLGPRTTRPGSGRSKSSI